MLGRPNNSLYFVTNSPSPAGNCTMNINPTANNLMNGEFQLINLYATRQFLKWLSDSSFSVGFLKTTNLHYRNMCPVNETNLVHNILYMFRTSLGPKHVEVIDKIDEIYWEYCALSWFNLQDYIEIHSQQNINFNFSSIHSCYNTTKYQKSSFEPSYLTSVLLVTAINTFFRTPLCLRSC